MNFKKTALLLAMAGIVAAPMAAQAETYASARIGLQHLDTGGDSDLTVRGFAARMGLKGEHDLGNGMTSFGKYEFGINTEGSASSATFADGDAVDEDGNDVTSVQTSENDTVTRRHAFVGLKGDFGSVTIGQTYHTFYNFAYGPTDLPWWGAGYAVVLSPGRTERGLTYAGSAGPVKFGATLYMDDTATDSSGDNEMMDGTELAASFDAAGIATFALAISAKKGELGEDPEDVTMITASNIMAGPVTLAIGYQMQEVGDSDPTAIIIHADLMGGYVHYEGLDSDTDGVGDPSSITLGYTQSIGRNTSAWYEYQSYDVDSGDSDDDESYIRAVLKVDF